MTQLTRFDTTAFNKALIGFDSLFTEFESKFASQISNNYPPYNVIKINENNYEIELAVAGFAKDEVTIEVDQNVLKINGHKTNQDEGIEYLHRGLAARNFERIFTLADHMVVQNAEMQDGMLKITLIREIPEELKPRVIDIK